MDNKEYLIKLSKILESPYLRELNNYGITDKVDIKYIFKEIYGDDIEIFYNNTIGTCFTISQGGKEIYYENSVYWYKKEYDERGNEIYYLNDKNYWGKWEYDYNNNCTKHENSDNYWCRYQYNDKSEIIFIEDSTGKNRIWNN